MKNFKNSSKNSDFPFKPSKSHFIEKSRIHDPALKDLNSLIPDFLQGKPTKASRQIFNNKEKFIEESPINGIKRFSLLENYEEKQSFSDDFSNDELEPNKITHFSNEITRNLSNPYDYYQNFKVSNLKKIENLQPNHYMISRKSEKNEKNESFYSDEEVENEKFVNEDKENIENYNKNEDFNILLKDFKGLTDKGFDDYDKLLINVEEYDNIIVKKRQNHASFAFFSLTFLKKILRKFMEGCQCLEDYLKAEKLLPRISSIFSENFQKQIKKIKNCDFKTQDLEILLDSEGDFYAKIRFFSENLQNLQKTINQAKILYSSMSSSKKFQQKTEENNEKSPEKMKKSQKSSLKDSKNLNNLLNSPLKFTKNQNPAKFLNFPPEFLQKSSENVTKTQEITQNSCISPYEIFQAFVEMKNFLINMLNLNFKQNLTEFNLKQRLSEKEEAINEKLEREINYNKSEEIVSLVTKAWNLFSMYKQAFITFEMKYLQFLKEMIEKSEKCYYKFFNIWQKLSFSMEALRKLFELNLEEIKVLELETNEILEKNIIKIQFPLIKYIKNNEKVLENIKEKREKLLNKVIKLKKETKNMRKKLKNEYFYILYMQKCDETLLKVSKLQHKLIAFCEILTLLKDFQVLEEILAKEPQKKNSELEIEEISVLKTKKTLYIQLFQMLWTYKNRVSELRKSFPIFFEIEKELNEEIDVFELKLTRIHEILEGKSPEILEMVENECEMIGKLIEKLRILTNSELNLKDFLAIIHKNPKIDAELNGKVNILQRLGYIHGMPSEKKKKMMGFYEEIKKFQGFFTEGKVVFRLIEEIKPEKVKKIFEEIDLNKVFDFEEKKEMKFENWVKEIEHNIELLTRNEVFSDEILRKDQFLNNALIFKEIFAMISADYSYNYNKLKMNNMPKMEDYLEKTKEMLSEIDNFFLKIQINDKISCFFITSKDLKALIERYFKETLLLLGNQANSLLKLSRKNKAVNYKQLLENYKENFFQKGIRIHTEEKLEEMTHSLKEAKTLRNEIKSEVLKKSKEKTMVYSINEVKDLVGELNNFIKGCLFMISIGGLYQTFGGKLIEIKKAFQEQEEMALTISQRIKETATDINNIKKKIKSCKAFLSKDFEEIYEDSNEIIEKTIDHFSVLYELLGDLNNFDGIFNENGFEINAKTQEFYEGLCLFIRFSTNYPSKKKALIENRQKLAMKLKNPELQELAKPLEGINVNFFKIIEQYSEEFDLEFLRFLEKNLKIINEKNIENVSNEVSTLLNDFYAKIKENMTDSSMVLMDLLVDMPKVLFQIKNVMEVFEIDLSYKGFLKNGIKKANEKASKMLTVEGLSECKSLFQKEKLNSWEMVFSQIYPILKGFIQDKKEENLKNLSDYKKTLFSLKKNCHSAHKEMTFINCFEELLSYDFKMRETV